MIVASSPPGHAMPFDTIATAPSTEARELRPLVLVVDDEENVRQSLVMRLERLGYTALQAKDGHDALEVVERTPTLGLVLCDISMPRMDGYGFLRQVSGRAGLSVIMMSAYGDRETEDRVLRLGAADFISKPFRTEELKARLSRVSAILVLADENQRLREDLQRESLDGFVGRSEPARAVMEAVRKVAAYASTVLLTGESGTGKELLAHALHTRSPRARGPFVAVNCAAIPESLLESELFGHEKGAFTGAHRQRPGLFEQASGGTLLLDEIGDMPRELQTRLLRVLEDSRVRRIGGERDITVDVRLVAATAQRLDQLVAAGRFREDLFYRLNVLHIPIPPLRERREDIPLLAETLVARASARLGLPLPRLSAEAMELLSASAWPGNVRQLEHALERAVILAQGQEIRPEDLPPELRVEPPPAAEPAPAPSPHAPLDDEDLSIKRQTERLERSLIARALERTGGNRTQAARLLDISYKALVYKIREYGIDS